MQAVLVKTSHISIVNICPPKSSFWLVLFAKSALGVKCGWKIFLRAMHNVYFMNLRSHQLLYQLNFLARLDQILSSGTVHSEEPKDFWLNIADSASAEYCSTFTYPSVCVSVHKRDILPFHSITFIRSCKPYIFWKLMTATIHWPLGDHMVTTWGPHGDHLVITVITRFNKFKYDKCRIRTVYFV